MIRFSKTVMSALFVTALASPALADNAQVQLDATSCLPGKACNSSTVSGYGDSGFAEESYATVAIEGYDSGSISAHAGFSPNPETLGDGGTFRNNASGYLTYTFQVKGTPGVVVPVNVYAQVSVSPIIASASDGSLLTLNPDGTPGATPFSIDAGASIQIYGNSSLNAMGNPNPSGDGMDVKNGTDFYYGLAGKTADIDETLYFVSDTDVTVSLDASASLIFSRAYLQDGASAIYGGVTASADPVFTIEDPAYSGFQIVGVPNDPLSTSSAPEPATWALMIVGLAGVGLTLRARRRPVPAGPAWSATSACAI